MTFAFIVVVVAIFRQLSSSFSSYG